MENKHNVAEEYDSFSDSIYESCTDNDYDDRSINMNALEDIRDGKYIHQDINVGDYIMRICDRINQVQGECK